MRLAGALRYRRLGKIGGLLKGGRYDSRTLAKYFKKKILYLSISRPLVRRVSRAKFEPIEWVRRPAPLYEAKRR
jgi:hypothetical protein